MANSDPTMDENLLSMIESLAIEIARGGGAILAEYFGTKVYTEYKDTDRTDPVTVADRECQQYLVEAISHRFPNHGIVGEEDEEIESNAESISPDTVWVLDPLDGTKNFINGLPVYACSVGVIHRGEPIVGAIYLPWPAKTEGTVLHARSGGGAFQDDRKLKIPAVDTPERNRLVGLPESFADTFRFKHEIRRRFGERRLSGSIAFELAMTAQGTMQYSLFIGPRLWDVAAGIVLVIEAGGILLVGSQEPGIVPLMNPSLSWRPGRPLVNWIHGKTTLGEVRQWSAPLIAGSPGIVHNVADNLVLKSSLRRRVSRKLR